MILIVKNALEFLNFVLDVKMAFPYLAIQILVEIVNQMNLNLKIKQQDLVIAKNG